MVFRVTSSVIIFYLFQNLIYCPKAMSAISPKKRNSIFDDSDDSDGEQESTKDTQPELPRKVNKTSKEENARSKKVEGRKETDKAQTKSTPGKGKEKDKVQTKSTPEKEADAEESPTKEKNEVAEGKEEITLSPAQMALIEKKRQQALLIRREKMNRKNPYMRAE